MPEARYLIVNADDFGQSAGVNAGIVAAHERGIVTSASLMVRWPASAEAASCAGARGLGLGLHLDLGEWAYREGAWEPVYEVVPVDDPAAVAEETGRQLEAFRRLTGEDPCHVDSHQHVHGREPVRAASLDLTAELGVPLRGCTPGIEYRGDFYGQTEEGAPVPGAISVEGLLAILSSLRPGVTELGCHPAEGDDLDTMYTSVRAEEVRVLCHPRVRQAIEAEGIQLRSFGELPAEHGGAGAGRPRIHRPAPAARG